MSTTSPQSQVHKHVAAKLGSFSFEFKYNSGDTADGRGNDFPTGRQPSSSGRSRSSSSQSREAASDDDCDREVEESRTRSFRSTPKFVSIRKKGSSRMQRSSPSSSRQPGHSLRQAFDELDDIVFGCNPIRGCTGDDRYTDDTAAVNMRDKRKDAVQCSRDSSGSFDDDSMITDDSFYPAGDDEHSDNTDLRDVEDDEETLNTLEDEDNKVSAMASTATKLQGSSNPTDTVRGPVVNTMMSPNSEQQLQMPTRSFFENETPRIGSRSSSIRNKKKNTYSFAASPGRHVSKDVPPRTRTMDSYGSAGTKSTFSGFNVDDASYTSPSIVQVNESKEPESFAEMLSNSETEDQSTNAGTRATTGVVTSASASAMVKDAEVSTAPVYASEANEESGFIETDEYGSHDIPQSDTRSSDITDNDDSSNVTDKITNKTAAVEKKRLAAKNEAELSGLDLIIEEVDYETVSSRDSSNDGLNQLGDQTEESKQSSNVENILLEKGRSEDPHEDYEVAFEDPKHPASKAKNTSKRPWCNWRVWLVTGIVLIVLVSLAAGLSSKRRNNAVESATVTGGSAPFSAALSPFTMQMELADGSELDEKKLEDITQTHISAPMKASLDNFDELQLDVTVDKKRRLAGTETNWDVIKASFEGTVFLINDSSLPTQEEMDDIVVDSFVGDNFDTFVSSMAEGGIELTSLSVVHDSSATSGSSPHHVSTVPTKPQVLANLTSALDSDSPTHSPDTNKPSSRPKMAPVSTAPVTNAPASAGPTSFPVSASLTTSSPTFSPSSTSAPDSDSPTHSPDTNKPSSWPTMAPESAGPTSFPVSASPTTSSPTFSPSSTPTTATPSANPTTISPSLKPTKTPTVPPSLNPTNTPTPLPIWENSAPGFLVTDFHEEIATDGVMFDVSAKESDIEITSIEIHLDSDASDIPVEVSAIQTSYMGWELYSRIWRSSNEYNIPYGFGYGKLTPIADKNFKPIKVTAGNTVGIYVTLLEGHKMLVGSGYESKSDAFAKVYSGASVPNRFASLERGVSWSGAIRYTTY